MTSSPLVMAYPHAYQASQLMVASPTFLSKINLVHVALIVPTWVPRVIRYIHRTSIVRRSTEEMWKYKYWREYHTTAVWFVHNVSKPSEVKGSNPPPLNPVYTLYPVRPVAAGHFTYVLPNTGKILTTEYKVMFRRRSNDPCRFVLLLCHQSAIKQRVIIW